MRSKSKIQLYVFYLPPIFLGLSTFFSCNLTKQGLTSEPIHAEERLGSKGTENKKYSKDLVKFEFLFFNANKEKILGNYDVAAKLFLTQIFELIVA